ncbi:MAG TPA: GUN4 domain-containing protein [Oscillatoriaceae cyanobacterium M33_DOE_052]|uniref:non-specific serine/threonine protein kinase n=1 Tax=Planktothricoides sp. SpSt-374 TaxID=2282167 RepID=A0A7C3ZJ35_9CYAN|nr:GUN4 domain-containing protein [Oscillatoriaceae cyanobacterium M33_DOE_052]
MTYCLIPGCLNPENPIDARVCHSCGSPLLLKERYRPIQFLGEGGMGRTFLAVDEDIPSKPKCVVKQLVFPQGGTSNVAKFTELFEREALHLDSLGSHPQIPTLLAHFEQNQWLYLVQEWISGQTLAQELADNGPFNQAQVVQLLEELLPVLKFIHEPRGRRSDRQIIHRDIKPANIMRRDISSPIKPGQLVLIDFGIAKLFAGSATFETATIVGTPEYMPPEQYHGQPLPASDLYSLGVTCIHLLTGISPRNLFDASQDKFQWRSHLPPGNPVSPKLGNILDKMLQNAVNLRYKSASEILRDLKTPSTATKQNTTRPNVNHPPAQPTTANFSPRTVWQQLLFWQKPIPRNDNLTSEVGIDYTKLRDLLAEQKWQQADEETRAVLCQALGKYPRGYIFNNEIEQLPCSDLRTIDRLWVKYSQGRFGFSIQALIYASADEDYGKFCAKVVWPTHNSDRLYQQMTFKLSAPVGHLPSRSWAAGTRWWGHAAALSARLQACDIN